MPILDPSLLASPAKLHLLALLLERMDTVGDLASALEISPSSVYQHLAWLHGRGFVTSSVQGRRKTFVLAPTVDERALRHALLNAALQGTAIRSGGAHLDHLREWASTPKAS
ncbi:helix-turn-helix domain-containing protein [Sinomonas sp. JGH33]|uniref:Helix-turn-helix domain-containing protein n=1 Tax=Sinomonas terricola TaxID=3110330 RepID=A0ABU5TA26_9MICC|nr:helix-turn-helix domain-containing protein [Sinomonas sp. JGH33]MEA5456543.1 helix-turn-helix domain-containing protein [Sinomonas sp. JGH33]